MIGEAEESKSGRKMEQYYGVVKKNTELFTTYKADYLLTRLEEFG